MNTPGIKSLVSITSHKAAKTLCPKDHGQETDFMSRVCQSAVKPEQGLPDSDPC